MSKIYEDKEKGEEFASGSAQIFALSLSSYILLIPYPYNRRFPLLYSACFQVVFKHLKIFICNRRVCLFFIRERARTRTREKHMQVLRVFLLIYSSHFKDKISRFLPFFQG